jgi:hypothetical protein
MMVVLEELVLELVDKEDHLVVSGVLMDQMAAAVVEQVVVVQTQALVLDSEVKVEQI